MRFEFEENSCLKNQSRTLDRKKGEKKRGALEWAKKEVIAKMAGTALAGISVAQ